jgi:hypothetical protein
MRYSAKKDNEYIDSLKNQRKKLRCDVDNLKKESDKYLDIIRHLHKQNKRLMYTTRKTGSNNRYLRGKISSLQSEHCNNTGNFSKHKNITNIRYLNTKDDYDGEDGVDPIDANVDFIPLGLPSGALSPPPLEQQGNVRLHKKRKKYVDPVEIFPRETRNGKRF